MAQGGNRYIFVNAGPIAHFSTGDVSKPLVGLEMSSDDQIHPEGYGFVIESGIFTLIADTEEIISEFGIESVTHNLTGSCLLYTSPSPRDGLLSRMPSSA